MRRAWIILAVALAAMACSAQTLHWRDNATVAWDAVTADEAGVPLDPEASVAYEVFIRNSTADVSTAATLGSTSETSFGLSIASMPRALYWVGVRTVITLGANVDRSEISWSNEDTATNNAPFGFVPKSGVYVVPKPKRIRIQ